MKIHFTTPLILFGVIFLILVNVVSVRAGNDDTSNHQNQTRPTVARPTSKPGSSHDNNSGGDAPIPPPLPTSTSTITPTVTQTMDLSFRNYFARNFAQGTPTFTAIPKIDRAPTRIVVTGTQPVSYSAPLQTITPMPGMYDMVMKGVILPVVIVAVIFLGIFVVRGLLLKRF